MIPLRGFGECTKLKSTTSGHYSLPLTLTLCSRDLEEVRPVSETVLAGSVRDDKYMIAKKLLRLFFLYKYY